MNTAITNFWENAKWISFAISQNLVYKKVQKIKEYLLSSAKENDRYFDEEEEEQVDEIDEDYEDDVDEAIPNTDNNNNNKNLLSTNVSSTNNSKQVSKTNSYNSSCSSGIYWFIN